MITIELQNLIFYEHHGVYEEERRVMNSFEVNLSVSYMDTIPVFEKIADTISYVNLFRIVQEKMKEPVFLLEKICQGIILNIKHQYPTLPTKCSMGACNLKMLILTSDTAGY